MGSSNHETHAGILNNQRPIPLFSYQDLILMNIGSAIKKARNAKNVDQGKLANLCKISQTHLSLIENGKKEPSIKLLKKIETKLEIPISVIMYLSITEDDIPQEKKEIFKSLNPSIQQLITTLFFPNDKIQKIS